MPIVEITSQTTPILVYDAPVNEKTLKLREMFKVDERTGYPEHYNWRPMARLGPSYKPEDPFLKFDKYKPEEYYAEKIAIGLLSGVLSLAAHSVYCYVARRPIWAAFHWPVIGTAAVYAGSDWYREEGLRRQGVKNNIIIDYTRKHPERFGETHRPKFREMLFIYNPNR